MGSLSRLLGGGKPLPNLPSDLPSDGMYLWTSLAPLSGSRL